MATMDFQNVRYGPNPFYMDQGGEMYYFFDVTFDDVPPVEVTYTIDIIDAQDAVVRTVSDTVPTNGQPTVHVERWLTPTTNLGGPLPFGNYRNRFTLEVPPAEGPSLLLTDYPTVVKTICSGRPVVPPQCDECDAACPAS